MAENILLKIVRTWNLSRWPEYRGFRCANCQEYMTKAWYHWLNDGGYKTPVHFCAKCEKDFLVSKIEVKKPQIIVDRVEFNPELPKAIKSKIAFIARKWDTSAEPEYKMFVCDECGRDMAKAWHVWANLNKVLIETHFCKECGKKLGLDKIIRGVIFDLDGTLISTLALHRAAWSATGKKFGVAISEEMLENQSGMADEKASLMMLPKEKRSLLQKFVAAKQKYVRENIKKASLFPGEVSAISDLIQKGYRVSICTSAYKFFVKKVLNLSPSLRKVIGGNIVWREMYARAKPSPDCLNLTLKKMGLASSQACYVGDVLSDYQTSLKAKVRFVYFCPDVKNQDKRIPEFVSRLTQWKNFATLT